jgi:ParB-like nuclease domain
VLETLKNGYQIERAIRVAPSQVEPNPWNPNKLKDLETKALSESIEWVGQVAEILVRPHPENEMPEYADTPSRYQIIDGEHRWQQLLEEEFIYVNIIHGLSDAEAVLLTVTMDSARGQLGTVDLAVLLASIKPDIEDFGKALPYSETGLDELLKLAEVDWEGQYEGDGGDDDPDPDIGDGGGEGEDLLELRLSIPRSQQYLLDDIYRKVIRKEPQLPNREAWGEVVVACAIAYRAFYGMKT